MVCCYMPGDILFLEKISTFSLRIFEISKMYFFSRQPRRDTIKYGLNILPTSF